MTAEPYVWEPEMRDEPDEDDLDFAWFWTREKQDLGSPTGDVVKSNWDGSEA